MNCGADIRLNTKATIDMIKQENPDAVIVATILHYLQPSILGIDGENVYRVADVDHHCVHLGKRVVVCGSSATGIKYAKSWLLRP